MLIDVACAPLARHWHTPLAHAAGTRHLALRVSQVLILKINARVRVLRCQGYALSSALLGFSTSLTRMPLRCRFVLPRALESTARIVFGEAAWPWHRTEQLVFSASLACIAALHEGPLRGAGQTAKSKKFYVTALEWCVR